ncbi:hypothetical protein B484DRAFT_428625 [Ochromonadaceae sp. CCMP2298]|nr:hypothetical protein B484DRAFT_428625 [Ochromonadaceae sp. CCMP2298]
MTYIRGLPTQSHVPVCHSVLFEVEGCKRTYGLNLTGLKQFIALETMKRGSRGSIGTPFQVSRLYCDMEAIADRDLRGEPTGAYEPSDRSTDIIDRHMIPCGKTEGCLVLSFDGTRAGLRNLVIAGFKLPTLVKDTPASQPGGWRTSYQSAKDCLPAVLFMGKDNATNAKIFLAAFFLWAPETIHADVGIDVPAWTIPLYPQEGAGLKDNKAFLEELGIPNAGMDKVRSKQMVAQWMQSSRVTLFGSVDSPTHIDSAAERLLKIELALRFGAGTALQDELILHRAQLPEADCFSYERQLARSQARLNKKTTSFMNDPCSIIIDPLHLRLRVGEQLLPRNVQYIYRNPTFNIAALRREKVSEVEEMINSQILRAVGGGVANYFIDVKDGTVSTMSIDEDRLAKVLAPASVELLHDIIFEGMPEERGRYRELCSLYNTLTTQLKRTEDFTPTQIDEFFDVCNAFGDLWIQLEGEESVKIYVHYNVSGHIQFFIVQHGYLASLENQGWETMNGVMKGYMARKIQGGGSKWRRGEVETIPTALRRYISRLWLYHFDNTEFSEGGSLDTMIVDLWRERDGRYRQSTSGCAPATQESEGHNDYVGVA